MGGNPNRTKGNAKPASQSRAIEALNVLGKKVMTNPFEWSLDSLTISDSGHSDMEKRITVLTKGLTKKEAATRIKALKGLCDMASNSETQTAFWAVYAPMFPNIFKALCEDSSHSIREMNQRLLHVLIQTDRKRAGRLAIQLVGYMYYSRFDEEQNVCRLSEQNFRFLFDKTGSLSDGERLVEKHCTLLNHSWDTLAKFMAFVTEPDFRMVFSKNYEHLRMVFIRFKIQMFLAKCLEGNSILPTVSTGISDLSRIYLESEFARMVLGSEPIVRSHYYRLATVLFGSGFKPNPIVVDFVMTRERDESVVDATFSCATSMFRADEHAWNHDKVFRWLEYWKSRNMHLVLEYLTDLIRVVPPNQRLAVSSPIMEYVCSFAHRCTTVDSQLAAGQAFCNILENLEKDVGSNAVFDFYMDQLHELTLNNLYPHLGSGPYLERLLVSYHDRFIDSDRHQELVEFGIRLLCSSVDSSWYSNVARTLFRGSWYSKMKLGSMLIGAWKSVSKCRYPVELCVMLLDTDKPEQEIMEQQVWDWISHLDVYVGRDKTRLELFSRLISRACDHPLELLFRHVLEPSRDMAIQIRAMIEIFKIDPIVERSQKTDCSCVQHIIEADALAELPESEMLLFFRCWLELCGDDDQGMANTFEDIHAKDSILGIMFFGAWLQHSGRELDGHLLRVFSLLLKSRTCTDMISLEKIFCSELTKEQQMVVVRHLVSFHESESADLESERIFDIQDEAQELYRLVASLLEQSQLDATEQIQFKLELGRRLAEVVDPLKHCLSALINEHFETQEYFCPVDILEYRAPSLDTYRYCCLGIACLFESKGEFEWSAQLALTCFRIETLFQVWKTSLLSFPLDETLSRTIQITAWIRTELLVRSYQDELVLDLKHPARDQLEELGYLNANQIEFVAGLETDWFLRPHLVEFCRTMHIRFIFPMELWEELDIRNRQHLDIAARIVAVHPSFVNRLTSAKCTAILDRIASQIQEGEQIENRYLMGVYNIVLSQATATEMPSFVTKALQHRDLFIKSEAMRSVKILNESLDGILVQADLGSIWGIRLASQCAEMDRIQIQYSLDDLTSHRSQKWMTDTIHMHLVQTKRSSLVDFEDLDQMIHSHNLEHLYRGRYFWSWISEKNVDHYQRLVDSTEFSLFWFLVGSQMRRGGNMDRLIWMLKQDHCKALDSLAKTFNAGIKVDGQEFSLQGFVTEETGCLWKWVYFSLLVHFPALVRDWKRITKIDTKGLEQFTKTQLSRRVIDREIIEIKSRSDQLLPLKIRVVESKSCSLICSFLVEGISVEMTLRFPHCYPLEPVLFKPGNRVGVSTQAWESMCRYSGILFSSSHMSLMDALQHWKNNSVQKFSGVEECPICYFVLDSSHTLPSLRCRTCRHSFHSGCLYKWFKKSSSSNCPMCRSPV